MNTENEHCTINGSCERVVSLQLVLLDNIPTAVLFLLGAVLAGMVWWPLGVLMLLYNFSAIIMFWGLICRHCPHFGTRACPCGYGIPAARYFERKEGSNFRKIFRRNISIMYPCWFLPFAAGIYLLWTASSAAVLVIFVIFCAVGFILIPVVSRFVGCKGCNIKDQCPWMKPAAVRK